MGTKIIKINPYDIDNAALAQAGEILRGGGLVAFPTETVYGLGANALDNDAVEKIYSAKGRPSDNPLIVHVHDLAQLGEIVQVNDTAHKLIQAFWPGPLTLVLPSLDKVAKRVSGGLDTVAVRMPKNKVAQAFLQTCNLPVAAPSANISGRPSPTDSAHVIADLDGRIDAIIDGGSCDFGIESTVLDVVGDVPIILRPGSITAKDIACVVGDVKAATMADEQSDIAPKSPGMKYKHYAPMAKVIAFEGNLKQAQDAIHSIIGGKKTGVFCRKNIYPNVDHVIEWGMDMQGAAHLLFSALREFDDRGVDLILCEPMDHTPLGDSIRNRLYKAANHCIKHIEK